MTNRKASAGQLRVPGLVRTLAGRSVDLEKMAEGHDGDIDIRDIAWGLGRTLRYGGHIREDYTVAMHSIVMSYIVPEEYALEGLLHDAAEGYIGDIIWPVKALFPEIERFEGKLLHTIMGAFAVPHETDIYGAYIKSPPIEQADGDLLAHESFEFCRPGTYMREVEQAWLRAALEHEQWWHASTYAFLERFDQLTGEHTLDVDELTKLWFPNDSYSARAVREAERALIEMTDKARAELAEEELEALENG